MGYEWLLFDADGTLFDYDAAEQSAFRRTFEHFGLPYTPKVLSDYRVINDLAWRALEDGSATPDQVKVDRFVSLMATLPFPETPDPVEVSARYLLNLGDSPHTIAGAEDVVREARDLARLALITNGLSAVQRSRLAKSGLGQYFEVLVISEEEGIAKPDPGYFDIVFERMGHPPKGSTLIIGDSLTSDMRGANLYGVDACWYNPKHRKRDPAVTVQYEIDDLRDVLAIAQAER